MKKSKSLKNVLTLSFLAVAVLPILLGGLIALWSLQVSVKEEITSKNFLLAKSLAAELQRFLDEPLALLEQIRDITEEHDIVSRKELPDYLSSLISRYTFFETILVLNKQGMVTYLTPFDENILGLDLSNQDYFINTKKLNAPYWSQTFISPLIGMPTLSLSLPLKDGMVVGNLKLAELNNISGRVKISDNGYAAVTDSDGTIIAHRNKAFVSERLNAKNISVIREGLAGHEGTFEYYFRGEEKIGSVAIVPQTGWIVLVTQPLTEAFASVKGIRNIVIGGILTAVLLAFLIALVSLRKVLDPLHKLTDQSQRIAGGEYTYNPQPASFTEINNLGSSFKTMIDAVKSREDALRLTQYSIDHSIDAAFRILSNGRIAYVNESACRSLGYTSEELCAMTVLDIDPEIPVERWSELLSTIRELFSMTFESRHRRKDGSLFPIEISINLLEFENQEIIFAFARDITERKRMEDEIHKGQKLESIGLLAGGIAHDFNNLLTAILSSLFLIKIKEVGNAPVLERVDAAEKAIMKAKGLTQQLLTFSKGGEPITEVADMRELINEALALSLRGSNVQCETHLSDCHCNAEVDSGQINQVINNIIINADQSMPEGGKIVIDCNIVSIGEDSPLPVKQGEYIKISFKDQGAGISEEHISKIFDPYFTTKQMGSGLGLSTVYSIVKKHDGHIDVHSEVGIGTVFNVYLPASIKRASFEKSKERPVIKGKGRVLIMDDEEPVRESLGSMLEHLGYSTECVSGGNEAVEIYMKAMNEDRPFDIVIMDLTIPGGMGGKEAIQELRKIDPDSKAIVSSGYSNDPVMSDFRKYGFCAVLPKPYKSVEELSHIISKALKGVS